MAILVLAGAATTGLGRVHLHELAWATDADHPDTLSFGGLWFVWVSRPIYTVLVLNWLWRLAVTAWLLGRVARLDLQLVPTHPDRCGGLGFLQRLPTAFAPLILAASCVLAARWGHDVLYHNVSLASLQGPAAVFLALALLLGLGPLLAFAPRLAALKRESLLTYGALVGRHGRLVRERWIRGKPVEDDGLLEAPELGPVADTLTLYEAVAKIRPVPIGRQAVLTVAAAALIPMIAVVTIKIPLKQQIMALGKVLM
jgi:hypothetical protein